jgi:hypothetical protein
MASEDEAMTAAEKADELWRIATDAVVNPTNTGSSPFSATDINLAEAAVEAVNPLNATHSAIHVTSLIASPPVVGDGTQVEEAAHCHLIRDIFGNPYRPVEVDPALLSDDVIALARTFYDSSTFNRLSKLAEALDRANCRDTVVLNHCRLETEHVRGCWVIDTILGFT